MDLVESAILLFRDEGISGERFADTIERLGFKQCLEHFFHCVRTRETPLTSAEDAFKTHELMDRILRSAGLPDLQKDYPYRDPMPRG